MGSPAGNATQPWSSAGADRYPTSSAGGFGVKGGLTPGRPRRVVENADYAGFVRRAVRAHGRRIAAGDVDALADLLAVATEVDRVVAVAVRGLRASGYSWAEIAARIDVTRQAAQQRWGTAEGVTGGG